MHPPDNPHGRQRLSGFEARKRFFPFHPPSQAGFFCALGFYRPPINVQDRQIFDSDIELRVEIVSALGVEEKTLFLNNNYFGELSVLDNNIYTIKVPKDVLLAENELRVRVMDNHFNIAEKSITVISNPQ